MGESDGSFRGPMSSAPLEGRFNGWLQAVAGECLMETEPVDVIEIFHPAIGCFECNGGLQLLCDGRFRAVNEKRHRGEIQRHDPISGGGFRRDGITESHVNLRRDSHIPEVGGEFDPHPSIEIVFADRRGLLKGPFDSIRRAGGRFADFFERNFQHFGIGWTKAEEVGIASRAVGVSDQSLKS